MSKRKDEDRELQIELTKLQIKHEEATSTYTIFLSVFVSLMLTTLSIYVPLGALTQNLVYVIFPTVFLIVLALPLKRVARSMEKAQKGLEKEIQELKDRFLSKQMPIEVKENQATENKTQLGNWKIWLKKAENVALILSLIFSIAALLFTGLSTYREWNPPASRAKLTIYIEYPQFIRATNSTITEVTVSITVVNDSPMSATIKEWNLTLNYTVTYEILNRFEKSGNLTLLPSAQTYFTITTTVEGQNHTVLPDIDIRSVIFTLSYQDNVGTQEATREFGFL